MTKVHIRKRIFYVPGLISLLGLPLVLWHFYGIEHKKANQRVITVSWLDYKHMRENPGFQNLKDTIYTFHPERDFQTIILTGNHTSDKVNLASFQVQLRKLIAGNDSVRGIKIHFGDSISYKSLIKVLDIRKIEDAENYWLYENNLYVWYEPSRILLDGPLHVFTFAEDTEKTDTRTFFEKLRSKWELVWTASWHIITAFLILCTLAIVYMRKQFW